MKRNIPPGTDFAEHHGRISSREPNFSHFNPERLKSWSVLKLRIFHIVFHIKLNAIPGGTWKMYLLQSNHALLDTFLRELMRNNI